MSAVIDPGNSDLQSCLYSGLSAFSQYRTSPLATCINDS